MLAIRRRGKYLGAQAGRTSDRERARSYKSRRGGEFGMGV